TVILVSSLEGMVQIKRVFEVISFIQSNFYAAHYILLKAWHLIIKNQKSTSCKIIEDVKKSYSNLTPYESNLLLHVYGIYYISDRANVSKQRHSMPIRFLKKINMDEYCNEEYYYHLAIGYHLIGSYIMAYFYSEKALHFFKETNNYAQSINAESVMLLQMSKDPAVDFSELIERYKSLIRNSEILGLNDKK